MNDLQKKVILITGVEKKVTGTGKQIIKIKDENNLSYQLWPIKADGTEGVAYQVFKTLPMDGVNMNVEIGFKEEPGEFNGKTVTYRTIATMRQTEQKPLGSKLAQQGMSRDKVEAEDDKWEKKDKAIRWMNSLGHATLLAAHGKIEVKDIKMWANNFNNMEPLGQKEETKEETKEELPTIQYPEIDSHVEDIDTSQIPF